MGQRSADGRLAYIDFLTVLACFGVVMLHVNEAIFKYHDTYAWYLVNVPIGNMFLWAVPVFLMISGATIIGFDRRYGIHDYAIHRVRRALAPFLFWSVAGLLFDVFVSHFLAPNLGFRRYLQMIISTSAPTMNILWFFIPLFAFYLCAPALTAIPEERRVRVFTYLIALSFITIVLLPNWLPRLGMNFNAGLENPMAAGFLIYPLLGYVLSRVRLRVSTECAVHALAVMGLIAMVAGTWIQSRGPGGLASYHGGLLDVPTFMMSMSVFLLAQRFATDRRARRMPAYFRFLPSLCLGIYMTHRFFLEVAVHFLPGFIYLWWWPFVSGPLLFVVAGAAAFLLKRVPLLRNVV